MSESRTKTVNAKEFLASFRERSDDFYLLEKYGINPSQLKRIYTALIEKGLLSEYEFHGREKKAHVMEEGERPQLAASTTVKIIEDPSVTLSERILRSGYSLDPTVSKAISEVINTRNRQALQNVAPKKAEQVTVNFCPNC